MITFPNTQHIFGTINTPELRLTPLTQVFAENLSSGINFIEYAE